MHPSEAIYSFNIGKLVIDIKPEAITQLVIVIILGILAWYLTKDLKVRPSSKKQIVVEYLYNFIRGIIDESMGEKYRGFIPYIGTLGIFLLSMNLTGLVAVQPPTKSLSVTVALAIISFCVIQGYAIKEHGIGGYFIGFTKPMPAMLPINIIERIMLPVSLSIRLFGNILAATIVIELAYEALASIGWIAQIGLPVPLHAYFDIFDGGIQMVVFTMLTMINIKVVADH